MKLDLHPWFLLERQLRNIRDDLIATWERMLKDTSLMERDYHRFLAEHAGFFFGDDRHKLFAVSKLQWGNTFESDFVIADDVQSLGIEYELIEIESPHDKPFNSKGMPSEHLSAARQQLLDWEQWIAANMPAALHLLPGSGRLYYGGLNVKRTLIIGTRANSEAFAAKRDAFAKDARISVRSFDWLTDLLTERRFPLVPHLRSTEFKLLSPEIKNELANPFYTAMGDAEWRSILTNGAFRPRAHIVANHVNLFLSARSYNKLNDTFNVAVSGLSADELQEAQATIERHRKYKLL